MNLSLEFYIIVLQLGFGVGFSNFGLGTGLGEEYSRILNVGLLVIQSTIKLI